jgi:hypothetical protein
MRRFLLIGALLSGNSLDHLAVPQIAPKRPTPHVEEAADP